MIELSQFSDSGPDVVHFRVVDRLSCHLISADEANTGLLLLVNKPVGWTSFDVVNKCRWLLRKRLGLKKFKVGHAGTLDPMATGLLLICTGNYTKRLQDLQGLDKGYSGTIRLGATTASYDADSPPEDLKPWDHLDLSTIRKAALPLTGDILQQPPIYSALKVDGKRAYTLARKGQEVTLAPRPVTIHQFDLKELQGPEVTFQVDCSKGTYIRSLAHDLGQALGCGAYLSSLQRDRIGSFNLENALHIQDVTNWVGDPNKQIESLS